MPTEQSNFTVDPTTFVTTIKTTVQPEDLEARSAEGPFDMAALAMTEADAGRSVADSIVAEMVNDGASVDVEVAISSGAVFHYTLTRSVGS